MIASGEHQSASATLGEAEHVSEPDSPEVASPEARSTKAANLESNLEQVQFTQALDIALIKFICIENRILFADDPVTWQFFHSSSIEYFEKFGHLTHEQLCNEFVDEVLPNIYCYDLHDGEQVAIALLELHPEYRRVDVGYERLPKQERPTAILQPKNNVDYRVEAHTFQPPLSPPHESEEFTLNQMPEASSHVVVVPHAHQQQQGGYGFQLSKETHALMSAMLSDDFELSGCVLHDLKQLHKRLRDSKKNFEQTAQMPRNCLPTDELLARIKNLSDLRTNLANILEESAEYPAN